MSRLRLSSHLCCWPLVLPMVLCHAAEPPRRAEPPHWSQDVLDVFFDDARQQLVGDRPLRTTGSSGEPTVAQPAGDLTQRSGAASRWSELIDADSLTAEIKRLNNQLATALKKSASFQAGGNLSCRRDFGLLAVLFGIVADFDLTVRWQQSAKRMQEGCFRTSQDCLTASAQSYTAAQAMQAILEALIRGQPPVAEAVDGQAEQHGLVDRALLMQSMEQASQARLSAALSNASEFRKRSQLVSSQAQLLAALAEVIQQTGYEDVDVDAYLAEARQLRQAALELAEAARERNYEVARAAAGRVSQSCARCHEGYRG